MAFIKLAQKYGAKLVRSKKHNIFRDAAGHQITAPKTTSDFRAIKNFESELKNRGFVNQETVSKVKDALVKGSKTTVLKPRTKPTVNRQTTFKDFTQKYQPNVQGPKRSELQVQADHILRTTKKARKMITKSQLDAMNISDKEKQKLIRQGLVNMGESVLPTIKTYKEFINEALARLFVKSVAKQVFKNRGFAKAAQNVIKPVTNAPKQLKFTKVYHGTNTPASAAISKGGYRTDKNVTRQMMGKGVYTSPDNYSAAMYGIRASRKYGGEPALRQLRVPQSVMQKQTTKVTKGTGDYSGKGYKMTTLSTQQANKYDVTDKLPKDKFDVEGPFMSPEKKRELRRRVRRGLRQRAGREELRRDIKRGEDQSLTALYRYRNNPQDPRTLEKVLRQKKKPLD